MKSIACRCSRRLSHFSQAGRVSEEILRRLIGRRTEQNGWICFRRSLETLLRNEFKKFKLDPP